MDPASILAAAGTVATVIEMCTDSLNALLRLRMKYKNADLTAQALLTQLSTLRAALSEISNWLDNGRHSCLANVFTDLTTFLDGCRCLIEHLNQRLKLDHAKPMKFLDKTRAIWGENERTEFLPLLGHNIAALQLQLTAMQCQSQSEQTVLLQNMTNLEIITRVRDNCSSLLFLRDDESIGTRRSICTMNSERLDYSFGFDPELFNSGPYISAWRSNTKYAIRDARSQAQADSSFADFARGLNSYNEDRRRATRAIRAKEQTSEDLRSWNGSENHQSTWRKDTTQSEHDQNAARSSRKRGRLLLRRPSFVNFGDSLSSKASLHSGIDSSSSAGQREKKLLVMGNSQANGSTIIRALEMAYRDLGLP